MKMSRKSVQVILIAACFIVGISGMASGLSIVNSKHDFSATSSGTSFGGETFLLENGLPVEEICVFCHTPHNAAAPGAYLWNRTNSAATSYTMYDSATLTNAVRTNMGTAPTGLTLMCMSCHDGISSIAVGTLINAPYSEYATGRSQVNLFLDKDKIGQLYNNTDMWVPGWRANIGNLNAYGSDTVPDLSNDHPVSFTWVTGISGIIEPDNLMSGSWGIDGAELKLFNGRMECSTCHNVHDNAKAPFLRMSNSNSIMCLSCHIK
jgi:predicted CXXCH cytochrome family protein